MRRCLVCDRESKTDTCWNCWKEQKRLRKEIQKEEINKHYKSLGIEFTK